HRWSSFFAMPSSGTERSISPPLVYLSRSFSYCLLPAARCSQSCRAVSSIPSSWRRKGGRLDEIRDRARLALHHVVEKRAHIERDRTAHFGFVGENLADNARSDQDESAWFG